MKTLVAVVLSLFTISSLTAKEESLSSINKKIKAAKTDLKKHEKSQKKIKDTIESLAKSIIEQRKKLKRLILTQSKLEEEIIALSKDSENKEEEIAELKSKKIKLIESKRGIETKIIDLMSSSIAKTLIIEKTKDYTTADIIKKEVFLKIRKQTDNEIKKIKKDFISSQREVDILDSRLAKITGTITSLKDKKEKIEKLRKEEKQELILLSNKQDRYSKKLESIVNQKRKERKLLADLDIIKSKTLEKVRKRESEERNRLATSRAKKSNTKVKRYGSSYLSVGKKHYRGQKYKPPLDDKYAFKVTKKFGPYVDPIYNIKIHNDYITLRSGTNNAVVRSVLGGKVVYADNLQTLGHVVIVKHNNNMHTIYRNLERISPNIRVNSRIKAREAVGRVKQELVFEVTKDGIPINPLELIRVPSKYI